MGPCFTRLDTDAEPGLGLRGAGELYLDPGDSAWIHDVLPFTIGELEQSIILYRNQQGLGHFERDAGGEVDSNGSLAVESLEGDT